MQRQPARALLIDLDGVLRRWEPPVAVEEKYGLEPGVLVRTAMTWDIYRPAVAEWQADRGYLDSDVLAFVRDVRAAGRPVGLATNATDRLRDDLTALGLDDDFDAVVSSWELQVHKPAPEFFTRAAAALGLDPHWILFIDDDDRAVRAARVAGMPAYRWSERRDFGYLRAALGIAGAPGG